ncbi:Oidioi.mRNA.OKI2018_I69.chr1.g1572.t1.cds [Oikopleura dioica]|uniref:Oidioi.mRNA.OKI2018_I69.chr1.g1572.t1.cds n=1 Tax=Oikopleura dioica TaxID=34765 RepID=A0ABN7SNU3_OIKDI|nr:Oidioi.mRNA.OKI2018_I69.chr1.g1572.t1.cds [Oikopleura dioica]
MIAPASLNYRVSADVFCGAPSYTNDYWRNVLHVTDGNNEFTPGSRTFALWRSVDAHVINIHTNNPNGDHISPNGQPDHSDVTGFACTPGEWHTFSIEVRQDTQMPSQLNADIQVDGTSIRSVSL